MQKTFSCTKIKKLIDYHQWYQARFKKQLKKGTAMNACGRFFFVSICVFIWSTHIRAISFTTLNKNDPYLFADTYYPYDYLKKFDDFACDDIEQQTKYDREHPETVQFCNKAVDVTNIKTHHCECRYRPLCCTRARFVCTAFYQSASRASPLNCGPDAPCPNDTDATVVPCDNAREIGDMLGNWNVLGLFYKYCNEPLLDANHFDPANTYTDLQIYLGNKFFTDPYYFPTPEPLNLINTVPTIPTFTSTTDQTALDGIAKELFDILINPLNSDSAKLKPLDVDTTSVTNRLGYLSIPIKYRKEGLRGQLFIDLYCNFGLLVQGGICHISQKPFIQSLTCSATQATCPNLSYLPLVVPPDDVNITFANLQTSIQKYLAAPMQLDKLAQTFDLNLACFEKFGLEDTQLSLIYRGYGEYNMHSKNPAFPRMIFTPFLAAQVSLPTGAERNPRQLFSLPTGSNGHFGYGGTVGFSIDFIDSIEFGVDLGVHQFTAKTDTNVPVPTHQLQQGLYPYSADLKVDPGLNCTVGVGFNAYHLVENLSLYSAYRGVFHAKDCISVASTQAYLKTCHRNDLTYNENNLHLQVTPPPANAVLVGKLENQSCWKTHMLLLGFGYDIARCINLGMSAQIPIRRCNAYRTSTILASISFTY